MKRLGKLQALAAGAVAAVALAAPLALAQTEGGARQGGKPHGAHGEGRGGRRGGMRGGHFGGGFFRGIELTDEQKTRLRQIHQAARERTQGLREQLRAKHAEVRQANQGATFNEALATQKLTEAASLQARLMAEEHRTHQEALSVLTAEQRTQLEQRRAERESRRGQRRGARKQQQL